MYIIARVVLSTLLMLVLLSPIVITSEAQSGPLEELAGLWKAKKRFGPDARGQLIIQKNGDSCFADMIGYKINVRQDKNELTFDLPDNQGTFRGRFEANDIRGHWIKPRTLVLGSYASPVVLKPDGAHRWRGIVNPMQDEFTLYLLAQKRPDGSLGVVLRNPDRDFGNQLGNELRLVREGNVIKIIGKRRGKTEESELVSGSYNPQIQMFTLTFPPIRGGSYDFYRDSDDSEFYPRGKNPGSYTYQPPPALDDGWPTSTLEAVNIDQARIEQAIQTLLDMSMDSAAAPQVHSILIARHGKLVLEEYFHGYHRDKLHDTRSASKSMTSVVAGAVMQSGAPLKLSSPVYQVMNGGTFPEGLEPGKRVMTLDHLLNMSSGFFCDDSNEQAPGNEETMWDQTEETNFYRYYMKVPLDTDRAPGEKAVYCSGDPNLALGMVGAATRESPLDLFDRLVGGPMKIRTYAWGLDLAGNPYGGGGSHYLARDFMKIGQLMLNDGMWEGRRILGRDYVARVSVPRYSLNKSEKNNYGYLWWHHDYSYEGRTVHDFHPGGNGGQFVLTIPELDLVIQTYNANYYNWGASTYVAFAKLVPEVILPAVRKDKGSK